MPQGKNNSLPQMLRKRSEFLAVRKGQTRRGKFFLLEVLNRGDNLAPRVGFTVTKKHGNAVERNRMKRRLRAAARLYGADVMRSGYDYVIVGRREILTAKFEDIAKSLTHRIQKT